MKMIVKGQKVIIAPNVKIWNFVVIGENTKIGEGTVIGSFCDIGKDIEIGKNCCIQAHVTISNGCRIEDNVFIAPNTSLLNDKYPRSKKLSPVIIKKGAIIGGGVTILPGIIIGENAVVGAGSTVTKDVPRKAVVAGVPAKQVMLLETYLFKKLLKEES